MFSKLSLSFILTASLACVGQVTTTGGYSTTSGASSTTVQVADSPLVSTPDVALPGSGPAVGAPLTSTNDSRTSTGASVYNPNYVSSVSGGAQAAFVSSNVPASGNEGFEFGIQRFVSGAPAASTPGQSLAEIARRIKAQHPKASRTFNNDSIAKLNADGVRTGNLGPETSGATNSTELAQAPAEGNTVTAENRVVANRSEQNIVPIVTDNQLARRPRATVHCVVPGATLKGVRAGAARQAVVPISPDDAVCPVASGQVVRQGERILTANAGGG